jgi:large subunit ribosomal protein L4
MPDAPVLGASSAKKVKLDQSAFAANFNGPLVHQSVRAEQAARRRGTAATKTRGMVSGGGRKPWKQKGSGRARAGSNRSPIWTGGGTVFGPKPRSYTFKVNRKEQRAALRSALSLHAERDSLAILDASVFAAPRTKQAFELLEDWGQAGPTLVVLSAEQEPAALSFRNLAGVAVLTHENVGVADLLSAASLLISHDALTALSARATSSSRGESAATASAAKATKAKANEPAAVQAKKPAADEPAAQAPAAAAADEPADETQGGEKGDAPAGEENS